MKPKRINAYGVDITVYRSDMDRTVVIEIDTPELGEPDAAPPKGLRVWLNDHCMQDNTKEAQ